MPEDRDVVRRLGDLCFVWDRSKAGRNLQKHGIALEAACEVFLDPFVRLLRSAVIDGEEREVAVGMTRDWKLLVVVYTFRKEAIRLISVRPATAPERTAYEDE